ncbi:MAG: sigma-54 dependent transcriptional regulator [Planctomycetota bacterium]
MHAARILIVDDDRAQAEALRRVLAIDGFDAIAVDSPSAALEELGRRVPAAIVSDFRMGSMSGLDLYHRVCQDHPDMLFIIATGFGSLDTAVKALKAGVHDFLTKPVDTDELVIKLRKALKLKTLENENVQLKKRLSRLGGMEIIARSSAMLSVLADIEHIAPSSATVLISGESGTGKEMVARTLHSKSPRVDGNYVKVNCAAIPENLLETELFGHEIGAFTGAVAKRDGKFKIADGGTIFLDEIGEMPIHLQPKILRVLQEREFEPVGSNEVVRVDVRVVAATNRDLKEMVEAGDFREDLFYRLNVIPMDLPPLRVRMEDLEPLAQHFLRKFCEQNGRELGPLSQEALARLASYEWPGNVRELENCMERAVVMARGAQLQASDFALGSQRKDGVATEILNQIIHTDLTLDEVERALIMMALDHCQGNVSQAARVLGLTRRTLQYRLEKMRGPETAENSSAESPDDGLKDD